MRQLQILAFILISYSSFSQQIVKIGTGVLPDMAVHTYPWNDSIILRGNFTFLPDNTASAGMAYWNGSHWKDLSLNTYSDGRAFMVYGGKLLMGGGLSFKSNSGQLPLLQLNGNTWVNVFGVTSSNSMGSINDMIVYKGELYVAGQLQRIGGKTVKNIAKWDGVAWSDVGGGCGGGVNEVNSLAILNNELYVGGFFENAGNKLVKHIAKWDGNSWSDLDSGVHQGAVSKIVAYKGKLIVFGGFLQAGSYPHLSNVYKGRAIWDGVNWSRFHGFAELVYEYAIKEYRGELFMGTYLNSKTKTINDTVMMSWDGIKYTNRLGANAEIEDISLVNDKLIITGSFTKMLNTDVSKMASYYLEPVGISIDKVKKSLFNIYPKPSNENINITNLSNFQNVKITIQNCLSENVKEFDLDFINNVSKLSIVDLPDGVYFVMFYADKMLIDVQKIIVQ